MFRQFGDVVSCKLMKDIYSGESRGFAFLTFDKKEQAQKAKDAMNYKDFHGWELKIYFKKANSEFN